MRIILDLEQTVTIQTERGNIVITQSFDCEDIPHHDNFKVKLEFPNDKDFAGELILNDCSY